tara:strand:+ start:1651 stop:2034 length:384 start_codon:yes stop_codon:yes gene_type:complete
MVNLDFGLLSYMASAKVFIYIDIVFMCQYYNCLRLASWLLYWLLYLKSNQSINFMASLNIADFIPVNDRFDELDKYQKVSINFLIHEIAKHQLSFEDCEQSKRTKDINHALKVLRSTLETRPARTIK